MNETYLTIHDIVYIDIVEVKLDITNDKIQIVFGYENCETPAFEVQTELIDKVYDSWTTKTIFYGFGGMLVSEPLKARIKFYLKELLEQIYNRCIDTNDAVNNLGEILERDLAYNPM